jgi:hypothetical protein
MEDFLLAKAAQQISKERYSTQELRKKLELDT